MKGKRFLAASLALLMFAGITGCKQSPSDTESDEYYWSIIEIGDDLPRAESVECLNRTMWN